jgi:NADPH:quinone reductase-like Zn-dependent oxidoreductase
MLVQLAKAHKCKVVGVVGAAHKLELAESIGCDVVIHKANNPDWWKQVEAATGGFDAIFDANGVSTFKHSYEHLAPAGRLIVYGFHSMLPKEGSGGRLTPCQWVRMAYNYLRSPTFDPLDMVPANKVRLSHSITQHHDSM